MSFKTVVSAVALAGLAGCASFKTGKTVDKGSYSKVVEGRTTEEQLIGLLGAPNMTNDSMVMGGWKASCGKLGDSIRMLTYTSSGSSGAMIGGYNSTIDNVSFYVNGKGVVCRKQKQNMNVATPGMFGS